MQNNQGLTKEIRTPVILLILDGWGVAADSPGNAIARARTPNFDELTKRYFTTTLHAAGESVGLKWGEMGNSEVGHLTIGSGRTIFQIQPRIDRAIIDGSFVQNEAFNGAMDEAKQKGKKLHLLGLLSDTGVHATLEHLYALLEMAKQKEIAEVSVHVILDGRDSPHNSGQRYLLQLRDKLASIGIGQIVSISGRFWAMDRDNKWERIARAYRAMVAPGVAAEGYTDAVSAIEESYKAGVFDEQFEPISIVGKDGKPEGLIESGDSVIIYNFRPDRGRQLTRALVDPDFTGFKREPLAGLNVATMAQYDESLPVTVAFPPEHIEGSLPGIFSQAKLRQLHVAETEKYAHVTYFISGGQEKPYPYEDRILVPSLGVDSYETKPQMSAPEIREKVLSDLREAGHDAYIINFANADMVGHTGNLKATIQAVETIDQSIGEIAQLAFKRGGLVFITSDHGNAEGMLKPNTGDIDKEHSAREVPFIAAGQGLERESVLEEAPDLSSFTPGGFLSDIAPTILKVMGLTPPPEMTGRSLI